MNLFPEWPLVLFTLTVQLAVGLNLALLSARNLLRAGHPAEGPGPGARDPYLWVGVLMAGALAVSLLHLGAPLSAVHSLSNLENSWLSREILVLLVFLGLWASGYWFGRRPGAPLWMASGLPWVTALAGIGLIGVMARIYMIPARPLWDQWLTAASFLLTTLSLGAAAGAAYLEHLRGSEAEPTEASRRTWPALLATGVVTSLAQAVATLAHPVTLHILDSGVGTSLVALRLFVLLGGAALLAIALARFASAEAPSPRRGKQRPWAAGALVLLVVSELIGRVLFYAVGPTNPF